MVSTNFGLYTVVSEQHQLHSADPVNRIWKSLSWAPQAEKGWEGYIVLVQRAVNSHV